MSFYSSNTDSYKALVKELARTLEVQFTGNSEARAAGMVINTMGWVEGVGFEVYSTYDHWIFSFSLLHCILH